MLIPETRLAELRAKGLVEARRWRWICAMERFREAHPEYALDERGHYKMLEPCLALGRMLDRLTSRPANAKDLKWFFAEYRDFEKLLIEAHRLVQQQFNRGGNDATRTS